MLIPDPIYFSYPYWFASAYPDIVRYFSELPDIELILAFKEMSILKEDSDKLEKDDSKTMDQEKEFYNLDFLYKLKEYYKKHILIKD